MAITMLIQLESLMRLERAAAAGDEQAAAIRDQLRTDQAMIRDQRAQIRAAQDVLAMYDKQYECTLREMVNYLLDHEQ